LQSPLTDSNRRPPPYHGSLGAVRACTRGHSRAPLSCKSSGWHVSGVPARDRARSRSCTRLVPAARCLFLEHATSCGSAASPLCWAGVRRCGPPGSGHDRPRTRDLRRGVTGVTKAFHRASPSRCKRRFVAFPWCRFWRVLSPGFTRSFPSRFHDGSRSPYLGGVNRTRPSNTPPRRPRIRMPLQPRMPARPWPCRGWPAGRPGGRPEVGSE
jgi:hypothetical protein